jgi:hypothetical protein
MHRAIFANITMQGVRCRWDERGGGQAAFLLDLWQNCQDPWVQGLNIRSMTRLARQCCNLDVVVPWRNSRFVARIARILRRCFEVDASQAKIRRFWEQLSRAIISFYRELPLSFVQ